ncbi:hypothetical protein BDF14DRAFT_70152 [Spinellus fusiger]|nr:hypothetical protein BDF14DRAFT_70152 [Spinellus fusiger]
MSESLMKELYKRLFHRYYVLHGVYALLFVLINLYYQISGGLFSSEVQASDNDVKAYSILAALTLWKSYVASTAEELTNVVLLYGKFFSVLVMYWHYGVWRLIFYCLGWIALSTFFPQPWYQGSTKIIELTESMLKDKLKSKKKKGKAPAYTSTDTIKGPRIVELTSDGEEPEEPKESETKTDTAKYWVVMLYANWSVSCLNFEGILAKVSLDYDCDDIKFGKIDIDIYPDMAQEFGVSRDPASFDLPTLLLLQDGVECCRLPQLTVAKEDGSGTKLSKANQAKNTITRLGWAKNTVSTDWK